MSAVPSITDSRYSVETPEAITLQADTAGLMPRALAMTADATIRSIIWLFVFLFIGTRGEAGLGIAFIIVFLLEWFYPVFFEVLWNGQTPGKKMLGLKVIHDDLTPISWNASILRNLLLFVDFLPVSYVFGSLSIAVSPQFKRLGDLAAGTLVVYSAPKAKPKKSKKKGQTTKKKEAWNVEPVMPPEGLSLDEQQALLEFYDRGHTLSEARREELVSFLGDALEETSVERVAGMGAWLRGGGVSAS